MKIKKLFDQKLKTFIEMKALADMKKDVQAHARLSLNQQRQQEHAITSLILLVHILKISNSLH